MDIPKERVYNVDDVAAVKAVIALKVGNAVVHREYSLLIICFLWVCLLWSASRLSLSCGCTVSISLREEICHPTPDGLTNCHLEHCTDARMDVEDRIRRSYSECVCYPLPPTRCVSVTESLIH